MYTIYKINDRVTCKKLCNSVTVDKVQHLQGRSEESMIVMHLHGSETTTLNLYMLVHVHLILTTTVVILIHSKCIVISIHVLVFRADVLSNSSQLLSDDY